MAPDLSEEKISPPGKLTGAEIGVGASIGKTSIQVAKLPRILVVSTGDELVEILQGKYIKKDLKLEKISQ